MNVHGDGDSHLDALCHVIYDGTGGPPPALTGEPHHRPVTSRLPVA